ncbi:transcription factor IIIA-like isoform X1 [Dermacentor albipictus]|uniref:transcription factor IIIA-like isoform X1 n=2 Tax=Dermacentor albipictus TaxID=60249 RepID=UPI0038FBE5C7
MASINGRSPSTSNETIFVCCFDGCSASFPNGKKLKWHMRVHDGDRPYECTYSGCNKKYTRQFHLTRHMKKSHESNKDKVKSFKCIHDNCEKVFSCENALYKHMKYSHEKRIFQCEHCPKAFVKHQHLKVHSFEHTKVLPYPCPEPGCDKAFLLPSKLRAHQNTHKGYPCDVEGCEAVFAKWTLLQKHRKIDHQKQFPCPACGRVFYTKWNLTTHAETHSAGRESFCCPHEGCSRFYFQEKNLRQHISSAHENKRFSCDAPGCTRTFFAKQSLKKHKASHDPNKPLPQKKPNKATMTCRRKNFPSKSAAAILSGHTPPAESEQRLLSPCVTATDEVELGQGQEDKESTSQFRNPASSHGVLTTCLDPTFSVNEVAEAMSLSKDFTQPACMPPSLANSLPDRLDNPSAQRELLQVALRHAVPEDAHLARGSQFSGQELCTHIKATLPVMGICDEGSARGALVDREQASECRGIVSEFEVGHENSFMVPVATVQRVTV